MTKIQILKKKSKTYQIIVSGHSGYDEEGKDIVCSAVSALAQNVCVGLENVLKLKPLIKIDESSAYLSCKVDNFEDEKVQLLFDTFEMSIKILLEGDKKLKKYIKLEVKNEIY